MKPTWKRRIAAVLVTASLAALVAPSAGGAGGGHSNGGTTAPPPVPFYKKPGWIKRYTPYKGCTHPSSWDGGGTRCKHWALPAYIVDCESGGAYKPDIPGGLNFGGAYGILENIWVLYGGKRLAGTDSARAAKPWQQDIIAHKIWIDVGGSGWACA